MRAIIIDDESIGIKALEVMIERYTPEVKVIATSTDAKTGIGLIEGYEPDILFLDISMPKMNAFELLEKLKFRDFKLVFTTAHREYALNAIKNRAHDYLLKPIDIGDLQQCVANIRKDLDQAGSERASRSNLELSVKDGIIFIKRQEIIRVEASGSYAIIYLANDVRHVVSKNLKEIEALLDRRQFYRCHASHIVNLHKVIKMSSHNGLFAQMSDGSMPEISKRNKEEFLLMLKKI